MSSQCEQQQPKSKYADGTASSGLEGACCEPEPPPLRIYGTVGVTSKCCIADGVQHQDISVSSSGASAEADVKQWGAAAFLGYQHADAEATAGATGLSYRVLYKEDNVVLLSSFKVCWWTCGGYPGKHVELQVVENGEKESALSNHCLPANSANCDCCCYTYSYVECMRCSEMEKRKRKPIRFVLTVVDGCGQQATCELTALTP